VVGILVLVMVNRDTGTEPVPAAASSQPATSTAPSAPTPNSGPLTGTFNADFGALTKLDGAPVDGPPPARETWDFRSACGANGCVATASRATGNVSASPVLVFDDVGGKWLAVAVAPGRCQETDVEGWITLVLYPSADGNSVAGEYSTSTPSGCGRKRTVTFTRTGDTDVERLDDPSKLPAGVVSPAEALRGRYRETITYPRWAPQVYEQAVRTDCLRTGDRCMSFFHSTDATTPLVFANGRWTQNTFYDTTCSLGGASHVTDNAEYPLPVQTQGPIIELIGSGHRTQSGVCGDTDYEDKFVRTGD
jgi:serine/threonine-protein kinase